MLDAAQKTISEIKNGDKNARIARASISSTDEVNCSYDLLKYSKSFV